jgi:hypothetical protein
VTRERTGPIDFVYSGGGEDHMKSTRLFASLCISLLLLSALFMLLSSVVYARSLDASSNCMHACSRFDKAYREGKIYHFVAHPSWVDWNEGKYADQHTTYISNRSDVWYVPLGLLYLYHQVAVMNPPRVTFMENEKYGTFTISMDKSEHEAYGVSYPVTYVFNISQDWSDGYVYYRYHDKDP